MTAEIERVPHLRPLVSAAPLLVAILLPALREPSMAPRTFSNTDIAPQ